MNLIHDAWIPVRHRNGAIAVIAPRQITEGNGEEFIELAAPRPDFNGALIQFLIGLVQTTCAPDTPRDWRKWVRNPPKPEELRSIFDSIAYAFELDGDGPRFMQDLTLTVDGSDRTPIGALLIETPGENTIKNNVDHFIKRGQIERLCSGCAATALFTLQVNAPSGGQGHRTGLRGGGPLTTLVLTESLWKTVWFNVLEKNIFLSKSGNPDKAVAGNHFPWLVPTRTSEKGKETTPEDVHPDQNFWAMPRRIRLILSTSDVTEVCDICNQVGQLFFKEYVTKNLGINYKGPWMHPLSPYFIDKEGVPSAIHPQPGGIGYRHWLGLVQSVTQSKGARQPARTIDHFVQQRRADLRLWAFGYDMDNMKARCWYDSVMPLILADKEKRKEFEASIASLVLASRQVASDTRSQLKKAMFDPKHETKGDLSFIEARFWQETEAEFFSCLLRLRDTLTAGDDASPILEVWHKTLTRTAEAIFDDLSQNGAFEAADPKRIALAWQDLRKSIYGKKLRQQLGLPDKA